MAPKFLRFQECIDTYPLEADVSEWLPICHTTDWGGFDKITLEGIKCTPCDKYVNENLAYFFYGKASYFIKGANKPVIGDEPPITLIYDIADIKSAIHRVLPFDSGGYELYKIRKGFDKEDFTYNLPHPDVLRRMVSILYKSNSDYFKINMSSTIDPKLRNMCRPLGELIRLHRMAGTGGTGEYGRQAFTFEVQYKETVIPFSPKIILLPITYFDDDEAKLEIEQFYSEADIQIAYYNDDETFVEGADSYTNMKKKVNELLADSYKN